MSLFDLFSDAGSGEASDFAYSLDTHAALSKEPSLFESASNVITKGIPLTGLAIVNSFANTGIEVANFFGAGIQKWSVGAELQDIGAADYEDYYKAHEQGIEGAAFALGSFIPGMTAIKALKLAQAGKVGGIIQRATGIFSGPRDVILQGAKEQILAGDAALFPSLRAEKYKAIALGAGDQALQALAFETAVTATMKASPLLEDKDFTEIGTDMFYGVLLGGGIGGFIEGIGIRAALNKAKLSADVSTKASELTEQYGFAPGATYKGTTLAGDRVVALMHSIDAIPDDTVSVLAAKKATETKDRAALTAQNLLVELAGGKGKEDLAQSLFGVLMKMKANGANKEEIYNYLAGASSLSRVDESFTGAVDDGFYINKFLGTKAAKSAKGVTFEDLISDHPNPSADISLRYRLREGAGKPVIATATDTYETPTGEKAFKYASSREAFDEGADIFIDKKLNLVVNPKAPNIEGRVPRPGEDRVLSLKEEQALGVTRGGTLPDGSKPLTGAGIILNTETGGVTNTAIPVVGDYGSQTLIPRGLAFGERESAQFPGTEITVDTPSLDVNARYIWAAKRGIKAGDEIHDTDIPMLEQLYRQVTSDKGGFEVAMDKLRNSGVTLSGGDDLPYSSSELINKITQAKNDYIHDLIEAHPNMSSEEVALRANVTEKYLQEAMGSAAIGDIIPDVNRFTVPNHIAINYDIGNPMTQDGQILRGYLDSQYRLQVVSDAAEAALAKEVGTNYKNFTINGLSSADATIEGARAGFLSFSNSNYGSLGQQVERIGRYLTLELQRRLGEMSRILAPHANAIRDNLQAAAELGAFTAVRQRTGEKYMFFPPELLSKYPQMTEDTAVLRSSMIKDRKGNVVGWNPDFAPDGFLRGRFKTDQAGEVLPGQLHTFYNLSPEVAAFERAQMGINDQTIISRNNWYAAQGIARATETGTLYAPPIDTSTYKHFALVKARPGTAFSDDSVSMITAETAELLEQKMAALRSDFSIYTKDMVADYHKALGDYQYDRNFMDSRVNSEFTRRGILNDIFPDVNPNTILQRYIDFNTRQTTRTLRDFVELGNAQTFAELEALGARYAGAETSQTGFLNKYFGNSAENPYQSYIKTALSIGPRDEYRLWQDAQEKLESFASTAYRMAKDTFRSAKDGVISYEEASGIMEKFGLPNPYAAAVNPLTAYYDVANKLPPTRILSKIVSTANAITAATAIRLDVMQSAITLISSPILTMAEASSVLKGIGSVELPDGSGRSVPGVSRLFFNAVNNFWNPAIREEWLPKYAAAQITRDVSSEYFEMINNLSLPYGKGWNESTILNNLTSAVNTATKFTGSQWTENFVRFVAADVSRQIYQSLGVVGTDLMDNISTFVNRVHGNYIASQRPVAFQGPLGSAIGLFQTYQINLFQQLFRYVENGEAKTLAILAGLQTSLFGLQSLPGYQLINQHLIGNSPGNIGHQDIYSTVANFFDPKLGNYLLYGVASNVLGAGLYSRGDINPRQLTVLPLNPLDYPAISGAVNFMSNLLNTADKVVQGAGIKDSLLLGLEHNGISRPLSGLGQMMQGYVSTGAGSLIAATSPHMGSNAAGWNDIISAANFSRLLGARPLDEAIAMDNQYRSTLYEAKDTARIERLGAAVKATLGGDTPLNGDDLSNFIKRYAASGGAIERFGQEMVRWSLDAKVSKANEIYQHLQKPLAQQMMIQMGGRQLPDFQNRGNESFNLAPPSTAPAGTPAPVKSILGSSAAQTLLPE